MLSLLQHRLGTHVSCHRSLISDNGQDNASMHSRRMHTARLLTVSGEGGLPNPWGLHGGGVCLTLGRGLHPGGVCPTLGGLHLGRGVCPTRGVCILGVYIQGVYPTPRGLHWGGGVLPNSRGVCIWDRGSAQLWGGLHPGGSAQPRGVCPTLGGLHPGGSAQPGEVGQTPPPVNRIT